jgi:pimeloyl-ACP methyl ester carboxylesterase
VQQEPRPAVVALEVVVPRWGLIQAQSSTLDYALWFTPTGEPGRTYDIVAPSRVDLVGYSNGGKLAYDVVCRRPSLVAAVAVVAAVPVAPCPAGAPVSLLQVARTADPQVRYDGAPGATVNGFALTVGRARPPRTRGVTATPTR